MTAAREALLRAVYAAYNRRDADGLLALVGDEVDWPDGSVRLRGKAALRDYWRRQWAQIHTHDEVVDLRSAPGDTSIVRIRQVVRDLDGAVVSRGAFDHVYRVRDGLVARLDIRRVVPRPGAPAGRAQGFKRGEPSMANDLDPAASHRVGGMTVTRLRDGILRHPAADVLRGVAPDAVPDLLSAAGLGPELVLDVNAFLLRNEGALVLVDAGCGDGMGPEKGFASRGLAEAGVAPDDIDLVLLTHMHPDHVGGLLDPGGRARFGRARVLAPAADAAVFLDEAAAAAAPEPYRPIYALARAVAAAYAGRFGTFEGDGDLAPGIAPVALPGHSPGHTGFRVTDGGASLLIWGDVVHVPALQFAHPEIGMTFDADPALADRTRAAALAAAAASGEAVAGMHMPGPGFGRVSRQGTVYRLEPLTPRD